MQTRLLAAKVPSMEALRAALRPEGIKPFHVGILIGPGFIPMDMVGVQTVFGLMPGTEIHLIWKAEESVEGFPGWWTRPTTTFAESPELDVLAVPMLPPEIQDDPEVIDFVRRQGAKAKYLIGICNGVLILAMAGLLKGKRATSGHNTLPILTELATRWGIAEVVPGGVGSVADGNVYTAGPGVGSFETSLLIAEKVFGRASAELAELIIEYDPHPPFGTGTAKAAPPAVVDQFEGMLAWMVAQYRQSALDSLRVVNN